MLFRSVPAPSIPGLDGAIPYPAAAIIASQQEQLILLQRQLQEVQGQLHQLQQDNKAMQGKQNPSVNMQRVNDPRSRMSDALVHSQQSAGEAAAEQAAESLPSLLPEDSVTPESPQDPSELEDPSEISMLEETFVTHVDPKDTSMLHVPFGTKSPPRSVSPVVPRSRVDASRPVAKVHTAATNSLPWAFDIPRIDVASEFEAATMLETPVRSFISSWLFLLIILSVPERHWRIWKRNT